MKLFLSLLALVITMSVSAQSICVTADCKDTVRYPAISVTLNGIAISPEGVKSVLWKTTSGSSLIANATIDSTTAALSVSGVYVYSFTGTSNKGAVGNAFDTVIYIGNQAPLAVVGAPVSTTTSTASLSGSLSTDPENLGLTYLWQQVSGPSASTINTTTMSNPLVSGLINGVYSFKLIVTDNGGLTSSATQTVSVNIPVPPPVTVTKVTTTVFFSDGTSKTTQVYP